MDENLSRPPSNVSLGELSHAVWTLLAEFTAFPWPVLKTQAARQGVDGADLTVDQLRDLAAGRHRGRPAARSVDPRLADLELIAIGGGVAAMRQCFGWAASLDADARRS
jgi:hypothetical protein